LLRGELLLRPWNLPIGPEDTGSTEPGDPSNLCLIVEVLNLMSNLKYAVPPRYRALLWLTVRLDDYNQTRFSL
jgi:hypothetical protein